MGLKSMLESLLHTPGEVKASRAGALLAFHAAGRPVWTPRDYAALAREGYARNPVVHRAVRMISEAAASVPLVLYEEDRELDRHPLLDLLARPSPMASGTALLEEVYGHLLVAGNAYLERVLIDGAARELHTLRPDRVKVVLGSDGWPEAFDYSVAGRTVRLGPSEADGRPTVLHLKVFHPLNDHYGFAPIEAAQVSLDLHNAAGAWNKALLDNAARPSGALVYGGAEGGNLSDEQFDRLKKELEEGYQGPRNAGRPLLLEGGLDWKPMGFTPRDMDFIAAKNQAAREIALAFGVPPMLLGIPGDNTYANFQEANRAFWRQTVLPLAGRVAEALARWLGPAEGTGLRLRPDADRVEALSSEREALWRRVGAADFLSASEKRVAVGYGADLPPDLPPEGSVEGGGDTSTPGAG
ncbi:phage portal protein [Stappia taiwanensis]|uniref:Phage portal protein n=2 Tax=Stappia taiwanensis TaxID=992267 RepID=A0A838XQQ0_9HYPH|nr:phage portal protein [Stappia taiwanensis]GGE94843.1 portal protein [Stappia taiwanensis]